MQNEKTDVLAPGYYGAFKCIADKCRHSCCVGWEISIDDAAYEKYKKIDGLFKTVTHGDDGACFSLRENRRCPHLNDSGLCDIIIAHGEDMLSEICKNHPRFFNRVGRGRVEVGLGIVCEEACRLILESTEPFSLVKADNCSAEQLDALDCGFDPIPGRDRIISMIYTAGCSFDERLSALRAEFDISEPGELDEWLDRLLELEILEAQWECDLRSMSGKLTRLAKTDDVQYDRYYERLLTYFVFRHVSMAQSAENLRARLAFSMLSVELIRALFESSKSLADECAIKTEGANRQSRREGLCKTAKAIAARRAPQSEAYKVNDTPGAPPELLDWARRYSAEIEYSEDNTDELIFSLESELPMGAQTRKDAEM